MKRLYKKLLVHETAYLHFLPEHERKVATEAEIAEAERALGVKLPKTYRQFCRELGAASWPKEILPASGLAFYPKDLERPSYLLAFATDGGGNDTCFDTRVATKHEYPIVYWDHEEPPDAASLKEPGYATPFDTWLMEEIEGALDQDSVEAAPWEERFERIERELAVHRLSSTWPWAPSEEQVAEVAAEVGVALPRDYVRFTTMLGGTPWPLEIVDATEIPRLTEEMRRLHGTPRGKAVAFARDRDGSYVVFRPRGKLGCVGGPPLTDTSFLAFLERRIDEASHASPAPPLEATPAETAVPLVSRPSRISGDERINSLWRAVSAAKAFEATALPDGRWQISIDKGADGRVRMFVEPAQWATVQAELAKWPR